MAFLPLASTFPPGTEFFEGNGAPMAKLPDGSFVAVFGGRTVPMDENSINDRLAYRKFGDATYPCSAETFDAEVVAFSPQVEPAPDLTPPESPLPLDLIYEALDMELLEVVKVLLMAPEAPAVFARHVRGKFGRQPSPDTTGEEPGNTGEPSVDLDSQEANEAAECDEKRLQTAAWVWTRLDLGQRENLLKAAGLLCGPEASREFRDEVEIRLL